MYFLTREKIERERVYGPGYFASSDLSLHGPPQQPQIQIQQVAPVAAPTENEKQNANQGKKADQALPPVPPTSVPAPSTSDEGPVIPPPLLNVKADYSIPLPSEAASSAYPLAN